MTITQTLVQQDAPATPVGKMSVYFCGGTGANLSERLKQTIVAFNRAGMADLSNFVIDTSKSNLNGPTPDNVFLYKGFDGFGKKRDEDPSAIKKKIPEILANFAPQDFNIVVSSLSGGSGSVIAPFIVRELLGQGKNVIMLGVVSTDTDTEIRNTTKTLGNLETISQSTGHPVVLKTAVNPANGNQATVDETLTLDILKLAMLFSRRNARLDQSDLRNWLQYNRVIDAPAKLVSLLFASNADIKAAESLIEEGVIPISVATLAPANTSTRAPWSVGYQATGFVPAKGASDLETALHFTIADGQIAKLYETLDAELKRLNATAAGTSFAKTVPVDRSDKMNDMFA